MTTDTTTDDERGYEAEVERVVTSATRIGTIWAKYGIEVGRAALQTSAATLEHTAELLGSISDTLDRVRGEHHTPTDDDAA